MPDMPNPPRPPDAGGAAVWVGGNNSGRVLAGSGNVVGDGNVVATHGGVAGALDPEARRALVARVREELVAPLATAVAEAAPPEVRDRALGHVAELAEAVTAPAPDLTTMAYVRNWLVKHVPKVAGAVTSLVVHPLVGKLVEAAGEAAAAEFRERFGGAPPATPAGTRAGAR